MSTSSNNAENQSVPSTIQTKLKELLKLSPKETRCIYRTPKRMCRLKEETYAPLVVSIGPFHHGDERLLPMETIKLRYLERFIHQHRDSDMALETYIKIIVDQEARIRESYGESIEMFTKEFVQMILVDSIFVIGLFYLGKDTDIMPLVNYMPACADLRLAENQLPFFILESLFSAAFEPQQPPFLLDLACEKLRLNKSRVKAECSHLLDLIRSDYLQPDPSHNIDQGSSRSTWRPTATSLQEAGVKFCVSEETCSLFEIRFDKEKGVLTIPSLAVHDQTESQFRNLIAFEQCHYYPDHNYVVDYLIFMDRLIDTAEDVRLLTKAKIILNWMGSENEVASLINSLGKHVTFNPDRYSYASTGQQLNDHCDKKWNRYRATVMNKYNNHPLAIVSFIYATVLLILTVGQLITGILALPT